MVTKTVHHCSEFTSFTGTLCVCVCVCVCVRVILCNVITHTDDTPPHSDYIPKRRDGLLSFWGEAWWRRTYTAYVLTSPTSMTGPLLGVEPSCLHLSW